MDSASKAGSSNYLRATGLLLRSEGVARRVIRCLRTRPAQLGAPRAMSLPVQALRAENRCSLQRPAPTRRTPPDDRPQRHPTRLPALPRPR